MSVLLDKSKENGFAALKLYDPEKKYAPSVHCAYYSCVQLMIHIIHKKEKISFEEIELNCNAWTRDPVNSGGAHMYYISRIKELLKDPKLKVVLPDFMQILDLKRFRVQSDYKPIVIDESLCNKAITLSEKLYKLLSKTFSIA